MRLKRFKSIMLLAATALLFAAPMAQGRTVNTLLINRLDGKTDRLAMHNDLDVRMGEKGDILLVHPQITCSYPMTAVKTLSFGYYNFSNGKYYIGDYELGKEPVETPPTGDEENGIAAPDVDGVSILISPERIEIEGLEGQAELYSLKGECVARARAINGSAVLEIGSLAKGVYVLTAGQTTLKIMI